MEYFQTKSVKYYRKLYFTKENSVVSFNYSGKSVFIKSSKIVKTKNKENY